MSTLRPTSAKILQHFNGMGVPNADLVRRRAQEIAFIAGHAEFSDEEWRQAKRELHGGHESEDGVDGAEMTSFVSGADMINSDPGHHVERRGMDDGENLAVELIAEGMDEAIHEQMIAARREEPRDEDYEGS